MLDFRQVDAKERDTFYPILSRSGDGAEQSFVNLCVWFSQFGGAAVEGDAVLIRYLDGYLFPLGNADPAEAFDALRADAERRGETLTLRFVTEPQRAWLQAHFPDGFSYEPDRDSWDYLYPVRQLADLPGKKLQAKRNHCNRFEERYDYELLPLGERELDQCRLLCEKWYETRPGEDFSVEKRAISCAFERFSDLKMEGLLLTADGFPAAFSMGSAISDRVFGVNYEKALAQFDGAYSVINRAFANYVSKTHPATVLLNREEDMGEAGLRQAKLSYRPILLKKYTATWRKTP